ncbi:MAG: murein biosynthesis integral membrane protein MurJ [Mycobacteriaceae bacterium]|nr:murein biosynthesis integral membrane protein MurJ [Mycobacteriaceae bacterium]
MNPTDQRGQSQLSESTAPARHRMPEPDESTPPPVKAELSDAALVSRSWRMAFATLISRITGFARIVLLATMLGAALSSAFTVANQLPNLVAALVLEATFTAVFVPVLARAEREDPDGGSAFVRRLVTLATAVLLVTTALSVLAAPVLVRLMLGRVPQVNEPLTTAFAYLLLPQVIFYGLTSVLMAILNTRNVFGPPAWAPVVNNVVAIATLGIYLLVPGQLSVDPVRMGNAKLLVLGIGTTLGVVAQAAMLLVAIRREQISLRPLWGIDQRLKRFGAMAAAMVLYVLISQLGLVIGNQIASAASASGPAIYNYTWLVLMLPFGMIGVTVLTVVMPRLSRNAAANDTPAVLADLSLAIRLTMITLIPAVAVMTVGGPAIGSALFAYGHFGAVDAGYLGGAIALSAFTLVPYALVLLALRVFYAREQPWIPIVIIVVITSVKVAASLLAPHLTQDPELVAGYLGLANGLGFLAGAVVSYYLLRASLHPEGNQLVCIQDVRTILVTLTASLLAGLIAHVVDRLLGLSILTARGGGLGSLVRLCLLALIMLPIMAAVMFSAQIPEVHSALRVVRRLTGRRVGAELCSTGLGQPSHRNSVTYSEQSNSFAASNNAAEGKPGQPVANIGRRKGPEVTDRPSDSAPSPAAASGQRARSAAPDDFQPDIPLDLSREAVVPSPQPIERPADPVCLVPGARIARERYRLLIFHGGTPHLQFWHALDTALDRQVALTFIDPDRILPDHEFQEILSRTLRLSRISSPGIARILDVFDTDVGGLVVSEWIRGGSLQEVSDTHPSPLGAVRAMQSLTAAAAAAHRAGVALSIDHPSRVRVSIDGNVVLAYPATMLDAHPQSDIRGIGAALYALLVNRWPLPEFGAGSGLQPAQLDVAGQPVQPSVIDPDVPVQISAVTLRAIHEDGGIRSASTLLNLLQQATAVADRTEDLDSVDEQESLAGLPQPTRRTAQAYARRRRGIMIGATAGFAIIAVALLILASILSRLFGDVGNGLDKNGLGLNAPSTASNTSSNSAAPSPAGSVVKPIRATVFSPGEDADNPAQAGMAIDGDPASAWSTDTYSDAVPFPGFKSGVGLLLQLPNPTVVGWVTLDVPSTGTKVEIRSSSTPTPAKLDDTTALTPPTLLQPGHNSIQLKTAPPTSNLLVWISTLGSTDGKSRTEISELIVRAAS